MKIENGILKNQSLKERKKEAKDLVIVLNSTGPSFDQYPWGNPDLTKRAMQLFQESLISYNKFTGLWRLGK